MSPHILVLAAGQGKRMHSSLPKVLHSVLFKPMIHYVLDLANSLSHASISVVVGHGNDQVRASCHNYSEITFYVQEQQRGTADAVRAAEPFLSEQSGSVLVLSGDVILLTQKSIQGLLDHHQSKKALATMLTATLPNPTDYGRVLRSRDGNIVSITEERDCTDEQRNIQEVNAGIYCFDIKALLSSLPKIVNRNDQGEYYLTDVIEILAKKNGGVRSFSLTDPLEMLGINDRKGLAEVQMQMQTRINEEWMKKGVTLQDPKTTYIDSTSMIGEDSIIEPGVILVRSKIGRGVTIEANSRITDSQIADECHIKQGSYIENSKVESQCSVGPYAHLRPESHLAKGVKVGNFVEIKKSSIGENSKVPHLSYVGDATIGSNVNLGCGFITCNYDGKQKHQTVIEDNVFVGSDSQTVAPVKIGKGSYVAAGSTVTDNVPPDSLVLSRGKQTTKPGYAKRYGK